MDLTTDGMGLCCWIESFKSLGPASQIGLALVCSLGGIFYLYRQRSKSRLVDARRSWVKAPRNVVVLHMFPRARDCPNPSPFPLKLETWLRVQNIQYVTDFKHAMSPDKGKSPWITLNGQDVADSQIALEHIVQELDLVTEALTEDQKALVIKHEKSDR